LFLSRKYTDLPVGIAFLFHPQELTDNHMTTIATLVVLAALMLVFNPARVLAILLLLVLVYVSPITTLVMLSLLAILYHYFLKWRKS
jgi:hypothetical protein